MHNNVALAKRILSDNSKVLYGIFGIINTSGYFPPCSLLNEFLMAGNDPCDQDGRMKNWKPFKLSSEEHSQCISLVAIKVPEHS